MLALVTMRNHSGFICYINRMTITRVAISIILNTFKSEIGNITNYDNKHILELFQEIQEINIRFKVLIALKATVKPQGYNLNYQKEHS